jgi:haloalkane dehalogenase
MSGLEGFFCKLIPASQQRHKIIIQDAGHFLQEDKGEEIAQYIDRFIQGELKVEKR